MQLHKVCHNTELILIRYDPLGCLHIVLQLLTDLENAGVKSPR